MNEYINISAELKAFFIKKKILKGLLPLDLLFVFGGILLLLVNCFTSMGGLIYALGYYGFIFGILLTYANFNQRYLFLGLISYGLIEAISFLRFALFETYRSIDYFALISSIIFFGLGYLVFRANNIKE